jgi:hypothetical protein
MNLVPIGRLHCCMIHVADLSLPLGMMLGPGGRWSEPQPGDLPYIGAYILGTLLLTLLFFQRRDV